MAVEIPLHTQNAVKPLLLTAELIMSQVSLQAESMQDLLITETDSLNLNHMRHLITESLEIAELIM